MRIASLSPAATETLFALGLADQIVCHDQCSNFPEEVEAIPMVMDHQRMKPEALTEYKPEIVLTGTVVQEKLAQALREAGFTDSLLHRPGPRLLEGGRSLYTWLFERLH